MIHLGKSIWVNIGAARDDPRVVIIWGVIVWILIKKKRPDVTVQICFTVWCDELEEARGQLSSVMKVYLFMIEQMLRIKLWYSVLIKG